MANHIDFKKQNIPFTMVANGVLYDQNLTMAAKCLYAYLYSKPDGWDFSAYRIAKDLGVSKPTIIKNVHELEKSGYLQRQRKNTGRVEYIVIYPPIEPQSKSFTMASEGATVKKSHGKKSLPISNTVLLSNTNNTSTKTSLVRPNRKNMYNYELIDENGNTIGEKKKRIKISKEENNFLISVGFLWRDMAKKELGIPEKDVVMKNIYYPIREVYNREKWKKGDFEDLFKYFFKDQRIPNSSKLSFDLCMSQKYVAQYKLAQKSKAKTNASLSGDIKL